MDRATLVQLSHSHEKGGDFGTRGDAQLEFSNADDVGSKVDAPGRDKRQGVPREDSHARGRCPATS